MEKVNSGDRVAISANTWNSFLDAAEYVKNVRRLPSGKGCRSGIGGGVVLVKNTEDTAFPRHSAVALTGICVTPETNEEEFLSCPSVFEGKLMTEERKGMPYAVFLEPIGQGEIGRALLFGVVPAQIYVSVVDHAFAVPTAGSEYGFMESSESGVARILWKEQGTGWRWALLQLGGTGGAAGGDGTFICRVWGGDEENGFRVSVRPADGRSGSVESEATLYVPDIALDAKLPSGTLVIGHKCSLVATGGMDV